MIQPPMPVPVVGFVEPVVTRSRPTISRRKGLHTLCCKIAYNTADNAQDDRNPRCDIARCWRCCHKSRDHARTPANHGPFPGKSEIEKNQGRRSEVACKAGVPAGHCSSQVGVEGGPAIEAQPSELEKDSAEQDEGDIMRTEIQHHFLFPSAKHHRVRQSRHSRTDLDGPAASIVHHTIHEAPASGAPRPACNGTVYESRP